MTKNTPNKRTTATAKPKAKSAKPPARKPKVTPKVSKSVPANATNKAKSNDNNTKVKSRGTAKVKSQQVKTTSTKSRSVKTKEKQTSAKPVTATPKRKRKPIYPVRWASRVAKKPTPDVTRAVLKSPMALLEGIESYFQWCKDNPWIKTLGVDRDGNVLSTPRTRPYLVEGLCKHIGISRKTWYLIQDETNKGYREDLMNVIEYANNELYEQKVTGAIVDDYKENIVSRLVALGDKREVTGERSPGSAKADAVRVQVESEIAYHADDIVKKLMAD